MVKALPTHQPLILQQQKESQNPAKDPWRLRLRHQNCLLWRHWQHSSLRFQLGKQDMKTAWSPQKIQRHGHQLQSLTYRFFVEIWNLSKSRHTAFTTATVRCALWWHCMHTLQTFLTHGTCCKDLQGSFSPGQDSRARYLLESSGSWTPSGVLLMNMGSWFSYRILVLTVKECQAFSVPLPSPLLNASRDWCCI